MNPTELENMIVAKGKTAPRLTPDLIMSKIVAEQYRVVFGVLTICILKLQNGFTVTGESACASPENFDEEIGQKIARGNAVQKIWGLEGYLLREKLHIMRRMKDELVASDDAPELQEGELIHKGIEPDDTPGFDYGTFKGNDRGTTTIEYSFIAVLVLVAAYYLLTHY